MDKYFDYAAATPLREEVLSSMLPFYEQRFHNPSALYGEGLSVRSEIQAARQRVAFALGVRPAEIIFTSGCTEANNLAIQGVMSRFPDKKILMSAIEHDAVRKPSARYVHDTVPVTNAGIIDIDSLKKYIDDDTVLISIMYVNNEIGTVQPLRKVAELVKEIRTQRGAGGLPLYLHTDAAQAPTTQSIIVSSIGVDMMSISGAKIYGPKGVGCLYIRRGIQLEPQIYGGGQEHGLRSGTEPSSLLVGFSVALEYVAKTREEESRRLRELTGRCAEVLINSGGKIVCKNTPSIISVYFPHADAEYLLYELDRRGFMVATGSACHAASGIKSHVLTALGMSDKEAKSVLRVSLGRFSNLENITKLGMELKDILAKN